MNAFGQELRAFALCMLEIPLANSEDPDEMQHNAASHHGLHCLVRLKHHSGTDIQYNLENFI